ncbi:MAG: hypothetical protein Q8941_21470 [Bacteroidota bacterium]|nr:hypothetical protein [Bacteroidota bacterium]
MRIIKLGLISIVFLSLLITGISLFFPSRVRISKAIEINGTREMIMRQTGDRQNWKNWYPGVDSIKSITITEKNDSSVRATIVGPGSKNIETGWNIFSTASGQPVTVQWYMDFHLRWYPWEKFSSLLLEKSYGPRMENGLSDLKRIVETTPALPKP